jgi:hypothetical protein
MSKNELLSLDLHYIHNNYSFERDILFAKLNEH